MQHRPSLICSLAAVATAVMLPACGGAPPGHTTGDFEALDRRLVRETRAPVHAALARDVYRGACTVLRARIDAATSNLANAYESGYRRIVVDAPPLQVVLSLVSRPESVGTVTASTRRVLAAVTDAAAGLVRRVDMAEGAIELSDRELDVAVEGPGFLIAASPDGALGFTRDGRLGIDEAGRLVTHGGWVLRPEVVIPVGTRDLEISRDGVVSGRIGGGDGSRVHLGDLVLARFADPTRLRASDDGRVFFATQAAGELLRVTPATRSSEGQVQGVLIQGAVERSNVQFAVELAELRSCVASLRAVTEAARARVGGGFRQR